MGTMDNKYFFEVDRSYDLLLMRMEENSAWFRVESTSYPDRLLQAIEYWHRCNVMSFSLSSDGRLFKKDFNVDAPFIADYLGYVRERNEVSLGLSARARKIAEKRP